MEIESKWCPECEQFHEHVGMLCVGCDLSEQDVKFAKSGQFDKIGASTKDKWMKEDWVVASDNGPVFSASQKKSCREHLGVDSTTRVRAGLYKCEIDEEEMFIGRPEAFEEQQIDYMLNPN